MYFIEEVWTRQDGSGRLGRGAGTFSQRRGACDGIISGVLRNIYFQVYYVKLALFGHIHNGRQ
jgi:hypothetical protein